jgi:hypothetical protein
MNGYIQTGIGIVVSVILFLIGYRQTIGARRERVGAANKAVYKALLRRLVLEDYSPNIEEINRLIAGKAQEFKVTPGDLHPNEQILNQVFGEIFDNDFIQNEKRADIERRLGGAYDQLSKGKQSLNEPTSDSSDRDRRRTLFTGLLGLLASLLGALTFLFLTMGRIFSPGQDIQTFRTLLPAFAVFITSFISVVSISLVRRVREAPEEPTSRTYAITDSASLEQEVALTLSGLGLAFQLEPQLRGYRPDFLAHVEGKRIVIDVKAWRYPPQLGIIARTARHLQEVLDANDADAAVIVTKKRLPVLGNIADAPRIQFVAIKELAAWIKSQRNSN